MTLRVDFVSGVEADSPGVARAQKPLVDALRRRSGLEVCQLRFSLPHPRLLFPFVYGPFAAELALRRPDVLHIGNAWYAHAAPLVRRPTVVTCHDLIELEELENGERSFRPHRRFHIHAAYRGLLQARFIVCVSRATADAIVARSPEVASRVRVIHSGLSPAFGPGEAARVPPGRRPEEMTGQPVPGHGSPYVLYVGSEQPRKNLERLVSALASVARSHEDLRFVKVGGHQTAAGRSAFLQALEREGMAARTQVLERVSDQRLASLYRHAAVTVLPSLREGFGFPALEAMACGCPVVVADRPALKEITDGAALAVDPLDVGAIAEGIDRVLRDEAVRRELAARGMRRAAAFTWDRAADAYVALYQEALAGA